MATDNVRVFVTNFSGHDYTDAKRYGELYYITRHYVSFGHLDRVKVDILKAIVEQGAKATDYLLLSGRDIISVVAALFWYEMFGQAKLLVWDKKEHQYQELLISQENTNDLLSTVNDAAEHGR